MQDLTQLSHNELIELQHTLMAQLMKVNDTIRQIELGIVNCGSTDSDTCEIEINNDPC